ncbi:MAG: hypothetical protein IT336_03950 [Thermomicrobiales bacterium]|nr:hypothetical protein [Thermomicrobiales bacterium]
MMPRPLAAILLLGLGACAAPETPFDPSRSNDAAVSPVFASAAENDLVFLRHAPGAPSFAAVTVSFWAHTKQDRQAELYYRPEPGAIDSTRFVRFRVPKGALKARPDGSAFAARDSILITLTIADTTRLMVDFQPSGLKFNEGKPARLWVSYLEVDPDRNGDGLVDATDQIQTVLSQIWMREAPGAAWESVKTSVDESAHDYSAKILGFTRYAVAY